MLTPDDSRHGTRGGYGYHRCRCESCRDAQREYAATRRAALRAQGLPSGDPRHGTVNGYDHYCCRCYECGAAAAARRRRAWRENPEREREHNRVWKEANPEAVANAAQRYVERRRGIAGAATVRGRYSAGEIAFLIKNRDLSIDEAAFALGRTPHSIAQKWIDLRKHEAELAARSDIRQIGRER